MQWGRLYGLAVGVEDGIAVPGVTLGPKRPAGPQTQVTLASADELDAAWPASGVVREREILHPEGDLLLSVDRHERAGYRIDAPNHALLLIEPGGAAVRFAPRDDNPAGAISVLLGQALSLAATLQGLEVLHAGAVVLDNRAAAICGHSGGGKSNLVARLVARGAELLADDALAVSVQDQTALGHPGPAFVHLLAEDADQIATGGRLSVIESFRTRKVALAAPARQEPARLAVLYTLDRGDGDHPVRIDEEPNAMLSVAAATFVTAARTGARLRNHMDVCTLIAAQAAVRRVDAGTSSSEDVADAVWNDLTSR